MLFTCVCVFVRVKLKTSLPYKTPKIQPLKHDFYVIYTPLTTRVTVKYDFKANIFQIFDEMLEFFFKLAEFKVTDCIITVSENHQSHHIK